MPDPATAPQTRPEQDYLQHLSQGRFMIQRSRASGAYVFYPRVAEPRTGATDLEWVPASGEGTVYATTVMRQRAPTPSYNLALIDLAEGPRMMSRVEGIAPDAVRIGMKVRARISREGDTPIVVFDPAQ
ncbi:MAG: OB-fold domain-containing protein [Burkholderiaceae bacterium]|jgi:uncharacterized OB-fold protein|nr:OB-fold domain-containing protein [Burkholderiaceae bacterium]